MAKVEVKALEYTCDGCGSIQIVTDEIAILGYSGTVLWQYPTGGDSAEWYADNKKCIAKAIINALDRDDR